MSCYIFRSSAFVAFALLDMPFPPPPPPGPPPPPSFVVASSRKNEADNRNQLLADIRGGTKLKKAVTNDRSAPVIEGK